MCRVATWFANVNKMYCKYIVIWFNWGGKKFFWVVGGGGGTFLTDLQLLYCIFRHI